MRERIPLLDLTPEVDALWGELTAAVEKVLRSGRFVLGPSVDAFESEAAAALGVRHAVGLNSGTDALVLGLRALGVGEGDEVLTPPFTFAATAGAIHQVGATPVFVDIEPASCNLDPALLEARLSPRTRAIVPVHLYGHPADLDPIVELARARDLVVLEDAAQAFGAEYRSRRVGGLGHAAAFSFYPSKNLGAYGDGGLLATNDDVVAARVRLLRNHGQTRFNHVEALGLNSRLDELQAAILRVKLPHVERWNAQRRRLAGAYGERLSGLRGLATPVEAAWARHVYHQYTVRILDGRRDAVAAALGERGVATALYYAEPLYRSPALGAAATPLPRAERAAGEVLSLPMGPYLTEAQLERVCAELERALARAATPPAAPRSRPGSGRAPR